MAGTWLWDKLVTGICFGAAEGASLSEKKARASREVCDSLFNAGTEEVDATPRR